MAEPPASKTLYVQRLNDKISKLDLKQALYYLFTPYGRILDIIALKTMKMRGQAFIAFRNANDAERAKQKLQGFELYGKKMVIDFARSTSNAVSIDMGEMPTPNGVANGKQGRSFIVDDDDDDEEEQERAKKRAKR